MKIREIDESAWPEKKPYTPQVGDDVRIKGDEVGQTLVGKVMRIGRSGLYHVKLANGEDIALPAKEISCRDMSCKNYKDFSWSKEEPIMKEAYNDEERFSEHMGGYLPPFNVNGGWVIDKEDELVLKCENPHFARLVSIALNEYVRKK